MSTSYTFTLSTFIAGYAEGLDNFSSVNIDNEIEGIGYSVDINDYGSIYAANGSNQVTTVDIAGNIPLKVDYPWSSFEVQMGGYGYVFPYVDPDDVYNSYQIIEMPIQGVEAGTSFETPLNYDSAVGRVIEYQGDREFTGIDVVSWGLESLDPNFSVDPNAVDLIVEFVNTGDVDLVIREVFVDFLGEPTTIAPNEYVVRPNETFVDYAYQNIEDVGAETIYYASTIYEIQEVEEPTTTTTTTTTTIAPTTTVIYTTELPIFPTQSPIDGSTSPRPPFKKTPEDFPLNFSFGISPFTTTTTTTTPEPTPQTTGNPTFIQKCPNGGCNTLGF